MRPSRYASATRLLIAAVAAVAVLASCRESPTPTFVPDLSNPGFRVDADDERGFAISYPNELVGRLPPGYANLYVGSFLTGTLALPEDGLKDLKVVLLRQSPTPEAHALSQVLAVSDSLDGLYFKRVQDVILGRVAVDGLRVVSGQETAVQGRAALVGVLEGSSSVAAAFRPLDIVMRGAAPTISGAAGDVVQGTKGPQPEQHRAMYLHIVDGRRGLSVICSPALSAAGADCGRVMASFRFLPPSKPSP